MRAQADSRPVVTIREVASEAGVSIATVSRVLSGNGQVSAPTRARVLAAVRQLRFTPSRLGRSLAERRHAANGIVFPDLSGPYYAEVVLGYEAAAAELGRSVLILSTHSRPAAREMVLNLAGRVDGLVILGRTVPDEVVAEIAERGTPLVLLARPPVGDIDSVTAENADSALELGRHLLADGRQRITFVGDPDSSPDIADRWTGLRDALSQVGAPSPTQLDPGGFGEEHGAEIARDLFARGLPEALVCANDELALGALAELRSSGVDVPGQVAVTGWDDVMAARYAGLTTVRQPMRQLGMKAAQALDACINNDRDRARHQVLPTEVVVRTSCAQQH